MSEPKTTKSEPKTTKKPGLFRRILGHAAPESALPAPQAEAETSAQADWWADLTRQSEANPAGTQVLFADEIIPPVVEERPNEPAPLQAVIPAVVVAEPIATPAPPPVVADAPSVAAPALKLSWWQRLKSGLTRTSSQIGRGISDIFTKRKLDGATLEDLEDLLIQADLGLPMASRIAGVVGKGRYDKTIDPDTVKAILSDEIEKVLTPVAHPLVLSAHKPHVILVVGVNGSGKTTTIGKLGATFTAQGKKIVLAAGDTFRAAAIEQLKIWGSRIGAEVIAREQGSDAAGLAFDALKAAKDSGADILMMDTAGRLQNRKELMDELEKIVRVLKKLDPEAPHTVLLVLDATVGQNALNQVEIFGKVAGVTGLVMTKLDGTARGGILVAIAEKFKLPVHFIGVGETVDDLEPFKARDFARAIAGLEQ